MAILVASERPQVYFSGVFLSGGDAGLAGVGPFVGGDTGAGDAGAIDFGAGEAGAGAAVAGGDDVEADAGAGVSTTRNTNSARCIGDDSFKPNWTFPPPPAKPPACRWLPPCG